MQRRTVLRSAVKLAYATPLIVATARLGQRGASASVPCDPPCGRCEYCPDAIPPDAPDDWQGGCWPIPGCI